MDKVVEQQKDRLYQRLEQTGELKKIQQFLRKRLIQSGWKDELKKYCKEYIRNKGMGNISVEELMGQIQTRGKHTIQPKIKNDVVNRIRNFMEKQNSS